jgi:hypothetical protein
MNRLALSPRQAISAKNGIADRAARSWAIRDTAQSGLRSRGKLIA